MSETRLPKREGESKRNPRIITWLYKLVIGLGLFLAGVYFLLVYALTPYLVERTAEALNRLVFHGDEVRLDDVKIVSFVPTKIHFKNLRARGKNSHEIEQDAIFAESATVTLDYQNLIRILFLFPDFDLSAYKATIQSIELDNCELQFEMISDSVSNFIIFRPDIKNLLKRDNRPDQIVIERMILRNVEFRVLSSIPDMMGLNFETRIFDFSFDSIDMGLDIGRKDIAFDVKGLDGQANYISFDTIRILENTPLNLNGDFVLFKMDRDQRARGETGTDVFFEDLNFRAENLSLGMGGTYKVENGKKTYQLHLKSSIKKTKTTLDSFLKILPQSNADLIRNYDVKGDLGLDVFFQKEDPNATDPHIEILFSSSNASFFPRIGIFKGDQRVRDLRLSGRFSNGSRNNFETSYIEIDSIRARLGVPIDFNGSIRFDSIYDPQKIHLTTAFNIDTANLADVLTMVDSVPHFESGGQVQLSLSLQGLVKNLNLQDIDKLKYNGEINLFGLKFNSHINHMPLRLGQLSGSLELVKNDIVINPMRPITGSINNHEINLTGVIYNVAQYIVRQKENLNPVWESSFKIQLDNVGMKELADSVNTWLRERRRILGLDSVNLRQRKGLNVYYDINSLTDNIGLDLLVESKNLDLSQIIDADTPEALQFDLFQMQLNLTKGLLTIPEISLFNATDSIWIEFQWDGLTDNRMVMASSIHFATTNLLQFISHFGSTIEFGKVHHAPITARGHIDLQALALEDEPSDSLVLAVKLVDLDLHGIDPEFSITDMSLLTKLGQDHMTKNSNERLLVDSILIRMDGSEVNGQIIVTDWRKEEFDLVINTLALPLSTIHKYLHLITKPDSELELALERIEGIEGGLKFRTHLTGSLDTLNIMKSLLYASQNGEIHFDNIGFEYEWIREDRPLKFENITGNFQFDPGGISFDHFSGYFGHSNFLLTGAGQDILPFIFDHRPLKASVDFQSEFLDLTDVVSNLSVQDKGQPTDTEYEGRSLIDILYLADFEAKASVQRAFFMVQQNQTVEIDNLIFESRVKDQTLSLHPFSLDYDSGGLEARIQADISDTANIGFNADFKLESIPLSGIYPLLFTGADRDRVQFGGDFWMDGDMQDTLRNGWTLSPSTTANFKNIRVDDASISNLDLMRHLRWDSLPSGARSGLKTALALNKDNWLDPEPRGMLRHDSLQIDSGVIFFYNMEIQSNKGHFEVHGKYSLEGPGTHVKSRILKARKEEQQNGRQRYNRIVPKDYTRSQFRPYIKYKLYSDRQKKTVAKEKGIEISQVAPGYYKFHSNLGYTLGTLPRRIKFLFAKNPNKHNPPAN